MDPERRTDLPHTGTINFISGIYRSDCCGVEREVKETHKFDPAMEVRLAAVTTTRIGRLSARRRRNEAVDSFSAISEQEAL